MDYWWIRNALWLLSSGFAFYSSYVPSINMNAASGIFCCDGTITDKVIV